MHLHDLAASSESDLSDRISIECILEDIYIFVILLLSDQYKFNMVTKCNFLNLSTLFINNVNVYICVYWIVVRTVKMQHSAQV